MEGATAADSTLAADSQVEREVVAARETGVVKVRLVGFSPGSGFRVLVDGILLLRGCTAAAGEGVGKE
jgi:hypothetical protein